MPSSDAEMLGAIKDVDAIMSGDFPLSGSLIEATNNLKIIARVGIGYDNVDLDAATRKGIIVTNVPGALSER